MQDPQLFVHWLAGAFLQHFLQTPYNPVSISFTMFPFDSPLWVTVSPFNPYILPMRSS